MRIAAIHATPVRVPVTRTGTMARAKRTHVSRTIVEVVTDDGSSGLGETRGEWSAAIINARFAPRLVGHAVADRHGARAACLPPYVDYGFAEQRLDINAYAAIDIALWDLVGKQAGLPLYALLGGAVRTRAPFGAYAYTVDLDEGYSEADVPPMMADIAVRAVEQSGAALFETKVGVHSPACEAATVRAISEALAGRAEIALDANMGYELAGARAFLAALADVPLANFEEPVPRLADMARLRREFPVPVSTHCVDFDALKPYPEIDAVVGDIHAQGGIGGILALIARADADGRRFWLRSMWELGISWAVMCHLGLAVAPLARPAQALVNWIADDLVLGDTWLVRDGGVRPPDTPGLGVELDREALARYTVG